MPTSTPTPPPSTASLIDAWAAARADLYLVIGRGADELRNALQRTAAATTTDRPRPRVVLAIHPQQDPLTAAQAAHEVASAPGFLPQRVACVIHPEDDSPHAQTVAAAAGAGAQRYIVCATTFALHARRFVHHTLRNVAWYAGSLDFASLQNACPGVPAIVVAAGPSLDESLPGLRRAQHHALILACDTAAPALQAAGVRAHAVASIDLQQHKQRALRALDNSALLVQQQYCHPRISAAWPRTAASRMFVGTPSPAADLLPPIAPVGETLSVAHAAFELARHLGCGPIVLCGLDLAFTDAARTHAAGCVGHWGERTPPRAEVWLPGLDGAEWPTLTSMQAMATSFESLIAELPTGVTVWNATARGLAIRGAQRATLDDVCDLHANESNVPDNLAALARPLQFNVDAQLQRLRDAANDPPAALVRMAAFQELLATRQLSAGGEQRARQFVQRVCRKAIRALERTSEPRPLGSGTVPHPTNVVGERMCRARES